MGAKNTVYQSSIELVKKSYILFDKNCNMRKRPFLTKENDFQKRKEHVRHSTSFQQYNQTFAGLNYSENNSKELFGRLLLV